MKNAFLIFLISFFLFSCKESENPDVSEMPQEWVLVGYKSSWVADPQLVPITDSLYNYRLEADGTFVKNIGKYRLTGTYDFETGSDEEKYINLNYDEASIKINKVWGSIGLIHYCGQNYEPFIILDSNTVTGQWGQCDGPNFIFKRR